MDPIQSDHDPATRPGQAPLVLSDDQKRGESEILVRHSAIAHRLKSGATLGPADRTLLLAGEAGSGKTTLMQHLAVRLEQHGYDVGFAATTNKAARVLATKTGRDVKTVHALAYARPCTDEGTGELLGFVPNEGGSVVLGPGALLIVDESSMVGKRLYDALFSALHASVIVLFVGDAGQLPPVKARRGVDLDNPHARLTQVHRQAADNPILQRARDLRRHQRVLTATCVSEWGHSVHHVEPRQIGVNLARGDVAVALTSTNRSRWAINEGVRAALEAPPLSAGPRAGDRVIATSTNRGLNIPNGEIGTVLESSKGSSVLGEPTWDVLVDWGEGIGESAVAVPKEVWCPSGREPWKPEKAAAVLSKLMQEGRGTTALERVLGLQAAWSTTVWKYQGSEAENGVIVLEPGSTDWRLGYTALTRFKQTVTFVTLRGVAQPRRSGPPVAPPSAPMPDAEFLRRWMGQ